MFKKTQLFYYKIEGCVLLYCRIVEFGPAYIYIHKECIAHKLIYSFH